MAQVINIEGIDGSGKGTQAKILHDRLTESGAKSQLISFPRYDETLFGQAVGDFLNGRFGDLDQVSPFLASLLYAGDRFESKQMLLTAIAENDDVVLDRYVSSNIAHQGSKLTGTERSKLIEWIQQVEYEIFGLPRPDQILLLNLPPQQAQELIARKAARTYTSREADIQEADGNYLAGVHEVYLELAASGSAWKVIDCLAGDSIRTIDEIAEEVWAASRGN